MPRASRYVAVGVSTIRAITEVHDGQRNTAPGPRTNAIRVAIIESAAQPAQRATAIVMSWPKICSSSPAIAFPSTINSVFMSAVSTFMVVPPLTSRRAKAFGVHPIRRQAHPNQQVGDGLHQQGRTAHVGSSARAEGFDDLVQHRRIDAPLVAAPSWRSLPGDGDEHLEPPAAAGELVELVARAQVARRSSSCAGSGIRREPSGGGRCVDPVGVPPTWATPG